ncbi:class I SAM-dependent methyltransferase [Chryseomicrobium sp. FSL W7-1435]|uniref:class I SAM-dependent methyltransferase n=1 Tax=Chryseomicrobium sp. FSL W7-1435 TaxID=2921704 RepID=UPI00315A07C0
MIPLIYDQVNTYEKDSEFLLKLLNQSSGKTVADLGCGTGRVTKKLAEAGYLVTAIDPNAEAIDYAIEHSLQSEIKWILGDSKDLQPKSYDFVIMTANVAQVFLTEESWLTTLRDIYQSLKPGGQLVFDTRNPAKRVWEYWQKDLTPDKATHPETGAALEIWTEYEGMEDDIFTFYETVKFVETGETIVREKMQLKFRSYEELMLSVKAVGFRDVVVFEDWEDKLANEQSHSFVFHAIK